MGMLKNTAIGNLTADPQIKYVKVGGNDVPVVEFSIGCNVGFGQKKETEFVRCTAWRKLAEILAQYGKKGRLVYVEGAQKTRDYETMVNGGPYKVYRTEWVVNDIQFLDSNNHNTQSASTQQPRKVFDDTTKQSANTNNPVPFEFKDEDMDNILGFESVSEEEAPF